MKTILVDLNVILNYLFEREGWEKAEAVLTACHRKQIDGWVSAHEITTLAYFLEKKNPDRGQTRKTLSRILDIFSVADIDKATLLNALYSETDDYEDAVIIEAAVKIGADCIVTNNIRDFTGSPIPAECP
jgi:predicted nucleic acid-binding protein